MTNHVHLLLTHHPFYVQLERKEVDRQAACRALFRSELDTEAIADIRLALDQGQPLPGLPDRIALAIELSHHDLEILTKS
jgi:hypothetical protein